MAALSDLRTLFYSYVGTKSSDPMYPTATVTTLLNTVADKYIEDVRQASAQYLSKTATLTPTASGSYAYDLPADFAGYVDVQLRDVAGSSLPEVRREELPCAGASFAIVGADGSAQLLASPAVGADTPLFLTYSYQPDELVLDTDEPRWMPRPFHSLLAREAAIDAMGFGAESEAARRFIEETEDRKAQFWARLTRRGTQALSIR